MVDLREKLHELGITQADFARLIGVTPRAVTLWLAGERPIPGPVDAYMRVMLLVPPNLRQIELNRLRAKGTGMRDGMFGITFQGQQGTGVGVIVLDNGRVYGTDEARVQYDGEYVFDESSDSVAVKVKVTFPPNVKAVFGISNPYEWSFFVTTKFNPNHDSGPLSLQTSMGRLLKGQFMFLRSLPDAA